MARPNRNQSKRRALFNNFSEKLRAIRPALNGKYMCPICLSVFERSAVDGHAPDLTLEHVVPKGLGSRLFVLTCRACNNDVGGAKLDAHVHRRVETHSFIKCNATQPSALMIGPHRLVVEWTRSDRESGPHNDLRVVAKATSPAAIEQSQALLKAATKDNMPEMTLRVPVSNPRHSKVALLKVGYLSAFFRAGYEFVLSSALDPVRAQIKDPAAEILPVNALVVGPFEPKAMQLPDPIREAMLKNTLLRIIRPPELDGAMATFELNGVGLYAVLLPQPETVAGFFARAERYRAANEALNVGLRLY